MVRIISLTQGMSALVDDEDFEELNKYKWYYAGGYARRNTRDEDGKRGREFMHRVIASTPSDMLTDHINGDTLDNTRKNLRNVTKSQNAKNARKLTPAKSKYKGVSFYKRKKDKIGKWGSKIQVDNESIYLGYFESEIAAALVYNEAALKYHGEYADLNEVEIMDLHEYQQLASRTMPKEKWFQSNVSNYSMGLAGEAGEVVDYLKKVIHHEHPVDIEEVKKELGDVLWYVSALATTFKIDLSEVAELNIEKLKKRYPEGFSTEDSLNRVDVENV